MIRPIVMLLSLSALAACAAPAPAPPAGAPDRGPEIIQMQLHSHASPSAASDMDGAQASAIYKRFIEEKPTDQPASASVSPLEGQ